MEYHKSAGFERYALIHQALPNLDLKGVDLSTVFLGKTLRAPLMVAPMTGGVERALRTLLRLRAGGDPEFQLYSRQSEKEWREFKRLEKEIAEERRIIEEEEGNLRLRERLVEGGPEVDRAIARVRRKLLKKV